RACTAVRALISRNNHCACRNVTRRACPSELTAGGRRARHGRSVFEALLAWRIGLAGLHWRWFPHPLSYPLVDRAIHLIQLPDKKMIRIRDFDQLFRFCESDKHLARHLDRAKLIPRSLNKQLWLVASGQKREVEPVHWQPQPDQRCHARILTANAQSHDGTKAEPGDELRDSSKLGSQKI